MIMPKKKYSVVTRPAKRKRLKGIPGVATIKSPTPAEKKLGLKRGDQLFVTESKPAALRHVNRTVTRNEPGEIFGISRAEIRGVRSFAAARKSRTKSARLVRRKGE